MNWIGDEIVIMLLNIFTVLISISLAEHLNVTQCSGR